MLQTSSFRREVGFLTGTALQHQNNGTGEGTENAKNKAAKVLALLSEATPVARLQMLRAQVAARRAAEEPATSSSSGVGGADSVSASGQDQAHLNAASVSLTVRTTQSKGRDDSSSALSLADGGSSDTDLRVPAKWTKLRGEDVTSMPGVPSFGEASQSPFRSTSLTGGGHLRPANDGSGRPAAFDPAKYLGPGSYNPKYSLQRTDAPPGTSGARSAVYMGPPHSTIVAPEMPRAPLLSEVGAQSLARGGGPGHYAPRHNATASFMGKHVQGAVDLHRTSSRSADKLDWRGFGAPPLSNPGVAQYDIARHQALWSDPLKHCYNEHGFGHGQRFADTPGMQPPRSHQDQHRALLHHPEKLLSLVAPPSDGAATAPGGKLGVAASRCKVAGSAERYDRHLQQYMHAMGIPELDEVAQYLSRDELNDLYGGASASSATEGGAADGTSEGNGNGSVSSPGGGKNKGDSKAGGVGGGGGGLGSVSMVRSGQRMSRQLENLLASAIAQAARPTDKKAGGEHKAFVPVVLRPAATTATTATTINNNNNAMTSHSSSSSKPPMHARKVSILPDMSDTIAQASTGEDVAAAMAAADVAAASASSATTSSSGTVASAGAAAILPTTAPPSSLELRARALLLGSSSSPSSSPRSRSRQRKVFRRMGQGLLDAQAEAAEAAAAAEKEEKDHFKLNKARAASSSPAARASARLEASSLAEARRVRALARAKEIYDHKQAQLRLKIADEDALAASNTTSGRGKLLVQRWLTFVVLARGGRFFENLLRFSRRMRSPTNLRIRAARRIQRFWRSWWARVSRERKVRALATLGRVFALFRVSMRITRKRKAAKLLRRFFQTVAAQNFQPALRVRLKHGAALDNPSTSSPSASAAAVVLAVDTSAARAAREREKKRQQSLFLARLKGAHGERTLVSLIRHFKAQVVSVQRAWRNYLLLRDFQVEMHVLLWDQVAEQAAQHSSLRHAFQSARAAATAGSGAGGGSVSSAAASLYRASTLVKPPDNNRAFRAQAAALRAEKEQRALEMAAEARNRAEDAKFGLLPLPPAESDATTAAATPDVGARPNTGSSAAGGRARGPTPPATARSLSPSGRLSRAPSVSARGSSDAAAVIPTPAAAVKTDSPLQQQRRVSLLSGPSYFVASVSSSSPVVAPRPPKPVQLKMEGVRFSVSDKRAVLLQALRHRKLRFLQVKRAWDLAKDKWVADQSEGLSAARRLLEPQPSELTVVPSSSPASVSASAAEAASASSRFSAEFFAAQYASSHPPPFLPRLMSQRQMVQLMNAAATARRDTRKSRYNTAALQQARLLHGGTGDEAQRHSSPGSSHFGSTSNIHNNEREDGLGRGLKVLFTPPPAQSRTSGGGGSGPSSGPGSGAGSPLNGSPRASLSNLARLGSMLTRRSSLSAPTGGSTPTKSVSPSASQPHVELVHTEAGLRDVLLKAWAAQLPMPTRRPPGSARSAAETVPLDANKRTPSSSQARRLSRPPSISRAHSRNTSATAASTTAGGATASVNVSSSTTSAVPPRTASPSLAARRFSESPRLTSTRILETREDVIFEI
jgi:hypothetical protein